MVRLFFLGMCLAGIAGAAESAKIQTLIFSGRNNHHWRTTTSCNVFVAASIHPFACIPQSRQ